MVKRIKCIQGDIIQIPLFDGLNGYGRILKVDIPKIYVELYKIKPVEIIHIEDLIGAEYILKLWTGNPGINNGQWKIIGHIPLVGEVIAPETWKSYLYREVKLPVDQPLGLFGYELARIEYSRALREAGLLDSEIQTDKTGLVTVGIFEEDIAQDVRKKFDQVIAQGGSANDAVKQIFKYFAEAIEDTDDNPVVYLAIATLLMQRGKLTEDICTKALEIIDSGKDLQRWNESKPETYTLRKKVLEDLKVRLLQG